MFVQCSVDSVDLKSSSAAAADERDQSISERDSICRSVVDILRGNSDRLDAIMSALDSVNRVMECTDDHDSETGERLDEPGDLSAADIMAMICNVETEVCDSSRFAVGFVGDEQADQSANA